MFTSPSEPGFDRVLIVAALILAAAALFEGRRRMAHKDPWKIAVGAWLFTSGTVGLWTAGWFVLALVLPPVYSHLSMFFIGIVTSVFAVGVMGALGKSLPDGRRASILLSLLYGIPLVVQAFVVPTFALVGWAGRLARYEALAWDAIPVVRPSELPSRGEALIRLADAKCPGRSVSYTVPSGKNSHRTEQFYVVGDVGWESPEPVPAWSHSCEDRWDLVSIDGAIPWRLWWEMPENFRNRPGAVVISPTTPAEVAILGRNASWICRIFLLLPLLPGAGIFGLAAPTPGEGRRDLKI